MRHRGGDVGEVAAAVLGHRHVRREPTIWPPTFYKPPALLGNPCRNHRLLGELPAIAVAVAIAAALVAAAVVLVIEALGVEVEHGCQRGALLDDSKRISLAFSIAPLTSSRISPFGNISTHEPWNVMTALSHAWRSCAGPSTPRHATLASARATSPRQSPRSIRQSRMASHTSVSLLCRTASSTVDRSKPSSSARSTAVIAAAAAACGCSEGSGERDRARSSVSWQSAGAQKSSTLRIVLLMLRWPSPSSSPDFSVRKKATVPTTMATSRKADRTPTTSRLREWPASESDDDIVVAACLARGGAAGAGWIARRRARAKS
nr:unnamed protein product [Digitaria exilis]